MSEYGFQAMPALATIRDFAGPGALAPDSAVLKAHQTFLAGEGNARLQFYLDQRLRPARDFADFVYLTQVNQAQAIELAALHHRACRPVTMGSLYWQLNDVWPAISWSSIDYDGRPKLLQYAARRFFAPQAIVAKHREGATRVVLLSDAAAPIAAEWRARNDDGRAAAVGAARAGDARAPIGGRGRADRRRCAVRRRPPAASYAVAELLIDGRVAGRTIVERAVPKDMAYPDPGLVARWQGTRLTISAERLARAVMIDFGAVAARPSDNGFDLLPGESVTVKVESSASAATLHLAVIGADADDLGVIEANYHGSAGAPVTPLAGLRARFDVVAYGQGSVLAEGAPVVVPETALVGLSAAYSVGGKTVVTRAERRIDTNLDRVAPAPALPLTGWQARWTARFTPPGPGRYRLVLDQAQCWKDCTTHDSATLDGSDAMNPDPDYSAAYVILDTDTPGLAGHGLTFTIGRGNEVCVAAIEALRPLVIGLELSAIAADPAATWRRLTGDSQLRWIGPDKGAMHLATGAVVNAIWDLWAKAAGKPVWRLVADMTPEQLVGCIDFRYLTDAITPDEALALLTERAEGKAARVSTLMAEGYPCYTTSAGWLGYDDAKLRRLVREAVAAGFRHVKLKVGQDLADDIRRVTIAREELGPERRLMIDANQVWEVSEAIDWVGALAFADPWFIEEPTSPDDVLGHRAIRAGVAPVKVATGEMCQNRILFKQFMAAGAIDVVQLDACRIGGVNEALAVLLLAARYDLPVCPHAGGVGLCEYVQHLSMIDYLCFAGTREGRVIEYVDHLHEHFVDPCVIRDAAYMPPTRPGFSIEMTAETLRDYRFAP